MRKDALAFAAATNKVMKSEAVILASDYQIPRRFSTGALGLDVIMGGGLPGNQFGEVLGPESHGKTFVTLKIVAANQRLDPDFVVFWLASEHYDPEQAEALGVDNTRVHLARERRMEHGLDQLLGAVESKAYDMYVLDSYPALIPLDEVETAMNEPHVASGAKLFNRFWREMGEAGKRAHDNSERPYCGLIINQWRDKIGPSKWTPQTSPGGHGKDYAYYYRLDVKRDEWITVDRPDPRPDVKNKPVKVGQVLAISTIKNKAAAPQQLIKLDAYFRDAPEYGMDRGAYDLSTDYVNIGLLYGVIRKSGGWYYYGDDQWNGADKLKTAIRSEPDLQEQLTKACLVAASDPKLVGTVSQDDVEEVGETGRRKVKRRGSK